MVQRMSWPKLGFIGFALRRAPDGRLIRNSPARLSLLFTLAPSFASLTREPCYHARRPKEIDRIGWLSLNPGDAIRLQTFAFVA